LKNAGPGCHLFLGTLLVLALVLIAAVACGKKAPPPETATTPGAHQPAELPDVPLYPTGKVLERAYSPEGAFQVRMLTAATSEEITSFYEDRLRTAGWRRVENIQENEFLAIYRKGAELLMVSILPTDNADEVLHVLNYYKED
jgi:hypothetical protein